jgi:hypothetical protein
VICTTLGDLHTAGVIYVASQLALALVIIIWIEACIYQLGSRDFGHKLFNWAWPILAVGVQAFGVVKWLLVSGASFDGNCDVEVHRM